MPSFLKAANRAVDRNISRFFARPFSTWAAMLLAFLFGCLSPLSLRLLDYKRFASWDYDFHSVAWVPLIFTLAVMALLWWQSKTYESNWSRNKIVGTILAFLLMGESLTISYFGCAAEHLCMGGHLDHPPYSRWIYLGDASWAGGLMIAAVAFGRCRSPFSATAAAIAGFLTSFRFIFGSFGGVYVWF